MELVGGGWMFEELGRDRSEGWGFSSILILLKGGGARVLKFGARAWGGRGRAGEWCRN